MSDFILEAKGITKTFPGVRALHCVDLALRKGEVLALVGENGAGKSTLMLTLGGIYRPDSGEIRVDGCPVRFTSAHDANQQGISIVYQELSLVPELSVAENIFANRQPVNKANLIRRKTMYAEARELLKTFNKEEIDVQAPVKSLSIANQQVVEILKAMSFNPKVLIMDEPTSSLTEREVKELFDNIRRLKKQGIAFIYISHHLKEIFEIADRVIVLRDGEYITESPVTDIDENYLITRMVGRQLEDTYGKHEVEVKNTAPVRFEASGLSKSNKFSDISFKIRAGEIVGFAGLVGAGRTEVGRAIFAADPLDRGNIYLDDQQLKLNSPRDAIQAGIGYLSEDRKAQGLYLNFSIRQNIIANRLSEFTRNGFLRESEVDKAAIECVQKFGVSTPGIDQKLMNLSGGNQQKVLLSMWFGIRPKLLIVDEPTRGVDVGAKSEIYTLLRKLAASGTAIMMISSDLLEILGMSDRIVVMRQGSIEGELDATDASEERIIALASGVSGNLERSTSSC